MKFEPPPDAVGAVPPARTFEIRIVFEIDDTEPPFKITGRRGMMHVAQIVSCDPPEGVHRDALVKMLIGVRVAGRGTICGVESFATARLSEGTAGRIGLLIDPP